MLTGRNTELQTLNNLYTSDKSTITVLYGRKWIGKTALIKEFAAGKNLLYYYAMPASLKEQTKLMCHAFGIEETKDDIQEMTYYDILNAVDTTKGRVIIAVEEFHNIVKYNNEFMSAVAAIVRENKKNIMFIMSSSSISWIENSMVSAVGRNALYISSFIKLKELSFLDTVRFFSQYSMKDCVRIYAICDGVPGIISRMSKKQPLEENIARYVLSEASMLKTLGYDIVNEELRETALYNTILTCLAQNENKLNDIHEYTGFGRDKISVYIKNLIEREIVEKVFSYDTKGLENARKGLYRIKSGFVEFWYRYVYPNYSALAVMEPKEFYHQYIEASFDDCVGEAFVKVCNEYIDMLVASGELPFAIEKRGRWWGKDGDIEIIAENSEQKVLAAKCVWSEELYTADMYNQFVNTMVSAKIEADIVYIFSGSGFDEGMEVIARNHDNLRLVSLDDM